ncbi:MAG: phospholipid carrier-dependent glycosyltransferase [Candidatus Woesearchaeota archaeon]|nr:phospholipid carrier-dependent glycosyltransferase [Candidatus Woesearchaeota archaeon]
MIGLLAAVFTVLACWAVGHLVLPKVPYRDFVAVGVGLCVLIGTLFIAHVAHIVTPLLVLGLACLGVLALCCARVQCQWKPVLSWWKKRTFIERCCLLLFLVLVLLHALGAAAPAIDADGLGYHLLVPKVFNEQQGFVNVPWNMYAAWPLNFDFLYGVGLLFESQAYGRYMHFLFGVLTAVLVFFAGRKYYNDRVGILAGLMLYATPMVGVLSGTSYIDLYVMYFGCLSFFLVYEWKNEWLLPFLAGLFAGALVGSKIVGFAFSIAFGAYFIYSSWKKQQLYSIVPFVSGAVLLSAPWLVKSYIMLGNPVWPFLYDVFGGAYWSSTAASALAAEVGAGTQSYFLFPFYLTFFSEQFGEMGFIGAGYLCFVGIALLYRRTTFMKQALLFVVAHLFVFYFLLHQMRYIIFLFPLLAIVAASALTVKWPKKVGNFLVGCFLLAVVLGLPFTVAYNGKSLPVALGFEERESYLARNLPPYETIAWVNANTPADAKVYTSAEAWTFYLEREHMWGAPNRQALVDFGVIQTGGDLHAVLLEYGVTHYMRPHYLVVGEQDRIEQEFVEEHCTVLYDEAGTVCIVQ